MRRGQHQRRADEHSAAEVVAAPVPQAAHVGESARGGSRASHNARQWRRLREGDAGGAEQQQRRREQELRPHCGVNSGHVIVWSILLCPLLEQQAWY